MVVRNRDQHLDIIRGVAVLMMIVFHFVYDLNFFALIDVKLFSDIPYLIWRYLIVNLFLIAVGISLVISYQKQILIAKFLKRLLYLAGAAIIVSIGTYIAFPTAWIYFGILHLIWVLTVIAIFFIRLPKLSLLIAVIILLLDLNNYLDLAFLNNIFASFLPDYTLDFYPLFPWAAAMFIGIFLGHYPYYKKLFKVNDSLKFIRFFGRHALFVYLTHQLILFPMVWGLSFLFN